MATIKGTSGANTLTGTTGIDQIYGYGGNDGLYGRAGNDSIWGGDGIDKIWGEAGNDTLRGENHDDHIYSGDGDDLVYGGAGNDQLFGDGGTDKIFGDAGNDILKGGTGKAILDGGSGNDTLYYGPTEADIGKIGRYFEGSVLDGNSGTDTLHVYNSATFGATKTPAHTNVFMWDDYHNQGSLFFSDHSGDSGQYETGNDFGSYVGVFANIEHLTFTGKGGMTYTSVYGKNPTSVTGTVADDFFYADASLDGHVVTYKGGAGNDSFVVGSGDKIISETNDADVFYFGPSSGGKTTTITGFNGADLAGGDIAQFSEAVLGNPGKQISEAGGWTTFSLDGGGAVKIQGVGLVENIDFFIA
jgi:Ca2+-binding RTX toxin-like protein